MSKHRFSCLCLQHEDLEAERLFDYSVLAPLPHATPLTTVTCHDTRLAGAGESLCLESIA